MDKDWEMTVPENARIPNVGHFEDEQKIPPLESAVPLVMMVLPCTPSMSILFGNIGLTCDMCFDTFNAPNISSLAAVTRT